MKTILTVVGNSGVARECYVIIQSLIEHGHNIELKGFLSFEGYPSDLKELTPYFLGIDDEYTFSPEEQVIIGIGSPDLRQKCYEKLAKRHVQFYSLIHPDVYIDKTVVLGEANIITSGCYISCNCQIGNGNLLNGVVHVGHDVQIGNWNFVGTGVQIAGNVRIGDLNSVGNLCALLPHCVIGNNNKIAPLSAVYKGCKNNSYMLGNPAYRVGTVEDAHTEK